MYFEFYGLSDEPFLLTPDHRFYYESKVHGQAMAHLLYGLSRGEGFIVITGEVGAGKTTLVQHLCASVDERHVVPAHVVTTLLSGQELLRMVANAFGLEQIPREKDGVLRLLQRFFDALARENRKALLIVDEAQNLSASALEELRMLSNFQFGSVSPCQIFLIGQPQFRATLAHPDLEQLRQRVIASYHLAGLSREECGAYLMHRLARVGWRDDPAFDESAIEAIYTHTGGMPRRINTLCSRLLLLGFLDNLHRFDGDDVARVAADLREESAAAPIAAAPARRAPREANDAGGHEGYAGPRLAARLALLEDRLDHQEKSLRRIALGLADIVSAPERRHG